MRAAVAVPSTKQEVEGRSAQCSSCCTGGVCGPARRRLLLLRGRASRKYCVLREDHSARVCTKAATVCGTATRNGRAPTQERKRSHSVPSIHHSALPWMQP